MVTELIKLVCQGATAAREEFFYAEDILTFEMYTLYLLIYLKFYIFRNACYTCRGKCTLRQLMPVDSHQSEDKVLPCSKVPAFGFDDPIRCLTTWMHIYYFFNIVLQTLQHLYALDCFLLFFSLFFFHPPPPTSPPS